MECFTPLPSPVRTPAVLAIPEQIFLLLRDYHKGSFEAGAWIDEGAKYECRTTKVVSNAASLMNGFKENSHLACKLFDNKDFQGSWQALTSAASVIKAIVQAEHPHTFLRLLDTIDEILSYGREGLAFATLRQVSAMAGLVLGENHPFKIVCAWLVSVTQTDRSRYEHVLGVSLSVIHGCFEEVLGPLHWTTIESKLESFWNSNLGERQDRGLLDLSKLLEECEVSLGPDDFRTLLVRHYLAEAYLAQNNLVKAKETAQALFAQTELTEYQIRGLYILAWSHYYLDETTAAETKKREAIELGILEWGRQDGNVQLMMSDLESWLLEWGKLDSAAQVREERKRSQAPAEIV